MGMAFKVLLFDLDGTLLDFKQTEETGLSYVFTQFQIPDPIACRKYYQQLNTQLWKGFEQDQYPKEYIFTQRFPMLLAHFHLQRDGKAMERSYRSWLDQGCDLMKDALAVVSQLARNYELHIITNGYASTQHHRLEKSGLRPYFDHVFVSEEIGWQKPQRAYFEHVLNHLDQPKESILVIGDSLIADIGGAKQAGLATCWIHAPGISNDTGIQSDFEITELKELWNILS